MCLSNILFSPKKLNYANPQHTYMYYFDLKISDRFEIQKL